MDDELLSEDERELRSLIGIRYTERGIEPFERNPQRCAELRARIEQEWDTWQQRDDFPA